MNETTQTLFDAVKTAYPDKAWSLLPFEYCGGNFAAIVFTHDGTAIHDPMASVDGMRFEQEDRYGLSEEWARKLRGHNRHYEQVVMGREPDLDAVFERIKTLMDTQSDLDVATFLDDHGFYVCDTGGGCSAYALFASDASHLMVTEDAGTTLPTSFASMTLGKYSPDNVCLASHEVAPATHSLPRPF